MNESLAVSVHHGDDVVIELAGDLDGRARAVMDDAWAEAARTANGRIVLDFAGLRFMNSTGIALVVEILGRARASGRDLHARGLSDHYRQIFEITRLSDFITLDEPAASPGA